MYAGKTGPLSALDILSDNLLSGLYVRGYGYNPVGLLMVVFAVDEVAASQLGPFDVQKSRIYENIGPVKDMREEIAVIVRISKAEKASEPESMDQSLSNKRIELGQTLQEKRKDAYSMKEEVAKDLKKLAALDVAKKKAEEFKRLVVKSGWNGALDEFNELHRKETGAAKTDPNVFALQDMRNLRRISKMSLETLVSQGVGDPTVDAFIASKGNERKVVDQLYSLIPQDTNSLDVVPMIVEVEPDMSFYLIKTLSVRRVDKNEYEKIKSFHGYKEDTIQSQSLAVVHFNPENILKRMRFKPLETEEETEADKPSAEKGV